MFTSWHALRRVIASLSISRCTWRKIAILSLIENRLRFASNGGASSVSPLVGGVGGEGGAGGPSLSEVIVWPADCAKDGAETMKKALQYVQLSRHLSGGAPGTVLLIFAEKSKGILYIQEHEKYRKISIGQKISRENTDVPCTVGIRNAVYRYVCGLL